MLEHTAGRLTIDQYGGVHIEGRPRVDRLCLVGVSLQGGSEGREEAEANTRRLVALWNGCEGFTTEALESGAVGALLAAVEAQHASDQHAKTCGECSIHVQCEEAIRLENAAYRLIASALRACGRGGTG